MKSVAQADTWETIFEGQTGNHYQLVSAAVNYAYAIPTGLRICSQVPASVIYSRSTKEELGCTYVHTCPAVLLSRNTAYIVQRRYGVTSPEGTKESAFVNTITVF